MEMNDWLISLLSTARTDLEGEIGFIRMILREVLVEKGELRPNTAIYLQLLSERRIIG